MLYFLMTIPYLGAAALVAAGANPWASFAAGYVIFIFILRGLAAED